jgi:hypothetical protein
VKRNDDLLRLYLCPETAEATETTSGNVL